jgi:hypothetical protein
MSLFLTALDMIRHLNISINRIFIDLNVQNASSQCPLQTSKMLVPTYWTEWFHGKEDRGPAVLVLCLEITKL